MFGLENSFIVFYINELNTCSNIFRTDLKYKYKFSVSVSSDRTGKIF